MEQFESKFESNDKLSLVSFFENRVLPYLSDEESKFYSDLQNAYDNGVSEYFLRQDYNELCSYDPEVDDEEKFYVTIIILSQLAAAKNHVSFPDVENIFLEKVTAYAHMLYHKAFFRNSYDSYTAWQDCLKFQRYQKLFYGLNVLPEGSKERIDEMSPVLDELWSRPEIEAEFRNAQADLLISNGGGEGSMADDILRNEDKLMSQKQHRDIFALRPDLVPENYDDYVEEFNQGNHPFILRL